MLTLTRKQLRQRSISNETKSLIQNQLPTLLERIKQSVYAGLCETMSPNDINFEADYESELDTVSEMILDAVEDYEI